MKIVIDIPEEDYDTLINHNDDSLTAIKARLNLWESLKQSTPLSENLTNGDMIRAMFPSIDFTEMDFIVHATTNVTSNGVKGGISYDFWKSWWNAPYRKGSEVKK